MNQNLVYSPSGISTRGAELDTIPSSSAGLDQDDRQSQLMDPTSRPFTSSSRFQSIEPYSQLPNVDSSVNGSFFASLLLDRFQNGNGGSQLTSASIHLKFSKLIKAEKKKLYKQNELIKEIQNWCNILTNDECKKLLYHYINILELEVETFNQLIKRREVINTQLLNVNKREKRTTELKLKRNKILVKLRENENKVGDSPITTLTKENLEELECSVEIVEDQFIRSINTGLKNSLAEYVMTTQTQSCKFKEISKKFLDSYYISNSNISSSNNSSLQRLILQKKLNSGLMTRDISTAHTNNPKYIALSPNQIGKYLDNRFTNDPENNSSMQPPPHSLQAESCQINDNQVKNQHNQQQQQQQQINQVNQGTILHLSTEELKAKGITQAQYLSIQPGIGPPPTASTTQQKNHRNGHKIEDVNNNDNDPTGFIINHYSTPGSLGARPLTSTNHEWT